MKIKRRLFSLLVTICLVIGLMPMTAFAVPTFYGLWVGGVKVTSENAGNITGEGIEEGTVIYDNSTKTLILNNATIIGYSSDGYQTNTDSAGIYTLVSSFSGDLTIKLIGENWIVGALHGNDESSYGIYNGADGKLKFEGSGKLNVSSASGSGWSIAIYSPDGGNIEVGAGCTITAKSESSKAIYLHSGNKVILNDAKVAAGNSYDDAAYVEAGADFDPKNYKYVKIKPASIQDVTAINVIGVTTPVIGQTPVYTAPSFTSTPASAVSVCENTTYRWLKIAKDSYTGGNDDIWSVMTSNERFAAGYYYCYGIEFQAKDGYELSRTITGTINGSACTDIVVSEDYPVKLQTVFGPLVATSSGESDNSSGEESSKPSPRMLNGNGTTVSAGNKKTLSFRSSAPLVDFIRVEMDGKELDKKYYTVKEGSTIVTLNEDYVSTLSVGEHIIGIVSKNGTATAKFTVKAMSQTVVTGDKQNSKLGIMSPQTGDNSNLFLWTTLLLVSSCGVFGTVVYGKKKRAK